MSEDRANEGWIEWAGGECPVDPNQMVVVQLRREAKRAGLMYPPHPGKSWRWSHVNDSPDDIIAYRIVQP